MSPSRRKRLAAVFATTAVLADDTTGPLFRRWLRCQDITAFRPGGHTSASRRYLANIGAQLQQARSEHDKLGARAGRLMALEQHENWCDFERELAADRGSRC